MVDGVGRAGPRGSCGWRVRSLQMWMDGSIVTGSLPQVKIGGRVDLTRNDIM